MLYEVITLEADRLQVANVTGMVVIHLVGCLAAGNMYLVGIDNNYIVAGVHVRREFRLVLAAQTAGYLGRKAPKCLAVGINDIPVAIHLMRFCGKCPHQGNSRPAQSKSGDVTKVACNLQVFCRLPAAVDIAAHPVVALVV